MVVATSGGRPLYEGSEYRHWLSQSAQRGLKFSAAAKVLFGSPRSGPAYVVIVVVIVSALAQRSRAKRQRTGTGTAGGNYGLLK